MQDPSCISRNGVKLIRENVLTGVNWVQDFWEVIETEFCQNLYLSLQMKKKNLKHFKEVKRSLLAAPVVFLHEVLHIPLLPMDFT